MPQFRVVLNEEDTNALLEFLGGQPYVQVAPHIQAIQQGVEEIEPEDSDKPAEK
jgi:GTP cyclohydrolase III